MLGDDMRQLREAINKGILDVEVYRGMKHKAQGDKDKAERRWLAAANNGSLHAMLSLGVLYEQKAEKLWRAAADQGNVDAMLHLERMQQSQ